MIGVFLIKTAFVTLKNPKNKAFCLNGVFTFRTSFLCLNVFLHPS